MVDRLRPIARAIRRSLSPQAYFKRKTSRIFRIGALSAGIGAPLDWQAKGAPCRDSFTDTESFKITPRGGWPKSIRMGGRLASEWVADFRQNGWPPSARTGGRFGPDYAA